MYNIRTQNSVNIERNCSPKIFCDKVERLHWWHPKTAHRPSHKSFCSANFLSFFLFTNCIILQIPSFHREHSLLKQLRQRYSGLTASLPFFVLHSPKRPKQFYFFFVISRPFSVFCILSGVCVCVFQCWLVRVFYVRWSKNLTLHKISKNVANTYKLADDSRPFSHFNCLEIMIRQELSCRKHEKRTEHGAPSISWNLLFGRTKKNQKQIRHTYTLHVNPKRHQHQSHSPRIERTRTTLAMAGTYIYTMSFIYITYTYLDWIIELLLLFCFHVHIFLHSIMVPWVCTL